MTRKETFPVLGMSCAACAARVDKALNVQSGVQSASVNYASNTVQVIYDDESCSPEWLKAAVQNAGYDLLIASKEEAEDEAEKVRQQRYRSLKRHTLWAMVLAVPIMVLIKLALENSRDLSWVATIISDELPPHVTKLKNKAQN